MSNNDPGTPAQRWARLRFAIVGPLLASPPRRGALHRELASLAKRTWTHPTSGLSVTFGISTIERWYYRAKNETRDPVAALRRAHRKDAGTHGLSERLRQMLRMQHKDHPGWSYQLHYDNLVALVAHHDDSFAHVPSYATVRRFMKACGLLKRKVLDTQEAGRPHWFGGARVGAEVE